MVEMTRNGWNEATSQSRAKGRADELDVEQWCMRKRGMKKGSSLENLTAWWVVFLRWRRRAAVCRSSQLYFHRAEMENKRVLDDKMMIAGEMTWRSMCARLTWSSVVAVVPPTLQVTESRSKQPAVSTFWLHSLLSLLMCPSSCSLIPYSGFGPTCLVLESHISFFWFISKLPICISALYTSLISGLTSSSRYSIRRYRDFFTLLTILQNWTRRTFAIQHLLSPNLWEENLTFIIC